MEGGVCGDEAPVLAEGSARLREDGVEVVEGFEVAADDGLVDQRPEPAVDMIVDRAGRLERAGFAQRVLKGDRIENDAG